MEIDCPPQAVAVWLEPDSLHVRFPDRQLIKIPAGEPQRLIVMLQGLLRERARATVRTVGTTAAPVQYDIDEVARQLRLDGASYDFAKQNGALIREKEEKRKRALLRKDEKRRKKEENEELCQLLGI